jgi:hypothetical protein
VRSRTDNEKADCAQHVVGSNACPLGDFAGEIDRVKQPAGSELLVGAGVHEASSIVLGR